MDISGSKSFYITTTLPYVNAEPHIGFAMELIRADIIARWKKSQGYNVFFNTGTDEHGQKLFVAAQKANTDVRDYVEQYAHKFQGLIPLLGISSDIHFIRTTDPTHEHAAQEFWKRVYDNGYIYKKNYRSKYCVGCEENKTESDLVDGRCPIHPHLSVELIEEENYFFKFSEFGEKLLNLYDTAEKEGRSFVVPGFRLNEMREFVKRGLEDFSISRLRSKMSWGIAVPNDPDHVMYVWFDALVSYIATLGWPDNEVQFNTFWTHGTPAQYCGKDNTRFQAVMWQAMLMAAHLPSSHTIVVNGFITSGGQKMSKSLGNVINPKEIVDEYGIDALRYFVARELSTFEDSDFTMQRFKDSYNANLANGLGNLVSRIMQLAEKNLDESVVNGPQIVLSDHFLSKYMDSFDIAKAMDLIWASISDLSQTVGKLDEVSDQRVNGIYVVNAISSIATLDRFLQESKPWEKENSAERKLLITRAVRELIGIAKGLEFFMPNTSEKILKAIRSNKKPDNLFPRKG